MALRIPAVLSVVVLAGCGGRVPTRGDARIADAPTCPVDGPLDAGSGCVQPCGDITGSTGLCHGMEVCVDPCGHCPAGCAPLV